jgi:hypothetical protein
LRNAKAKKQTIETGLHRAAGHFQLFGNLSVVATLQQQFDDLSISGTKAYRPILHAISFSRFRFALANEQP